MDADPVSLVTALTGCDESEAITYLEMTNWNPEAAANLIMNNKDDNMIPLESLNPMIPNEDFPIMDDSLPMMEEDFEEFTSEYVIPLPSVQDTLLSRAEEEMQNEGRGSSDKDEDWMFPPPKDLIVKAPFSRAKELAVEQGKQLLVNLLNVEIFVSHQMNKDIWGNDAVKEVVSNSLVFCQWDVSDVEGEKVVSLYRVDPNSLPVILLIDPLTGGKMKSWEGKLHFMDFLSQLMDAMNSENRGESSGGGITTLENGVEEKNLEEGNEGQQQEEDENNEEEGQEDKEDEEEEEQEGVEEEDLEERGEEVKIMVRQPDGKREKLTIGGESSIALLFHKIQVEGPFDLFTANPPISLLPLKNELISSHNLKGSVVSVKKI